MWLDRAVKWLLPREDHFFELLESSADVGLRCSGVLVECCEAGSPEEREAKVTRMHELEHEADRVIQEVYERLNKTFVTPMDRSDIYSLATDLENIVDSMHETGSQVVTHALDDLPEGSVELARSIQAACVELHAAVALLRGFKQLDRIRNHCRQVTMLESKGDQIFRSQMARMFKEEANAIHLMKHKEFLEGLERTLDACDNVANALESIVIKNA